jgi:hypothetical protein
MYYNDGQYGHHHVTAVQGTAGTRCMNNAFDAYQSAYGDHAIGHLMGANVANDYGDFMSEQAPVDTVPVPGYVGQPQCHMSQPQPEEDMQMVAAAQEMMQKAQGALGDISVPGLNGLGDVNPYLIVAALVAGYLAYVGKLTTPQLINQTDVMVLAVLAVVVFFLL